MGAERPVEAGGRRRADQPAEGEEPAGDLEHVARHPAHAPASGPRRPDLLVGRLHDVLQRVQHELERRTARAAASTATAPGAPRPALRSMMTASRSVPEMPSTNAWCVLASMAQRPSSRPSTTQISQSGLERSSCCAMTRPTSLRSSLSPPGEGSAVWRRWYSMLKCGSSTQTGSSQLEGYEADLLAVARDQVELGVHHGDDVAEGRRGALEDGDRGDVHVGHVVLNVEERCVQRAQAIRTHGPSLRASPGPQRYPRARSVLPGSAGGGGGERAAQRGELGRGENAARGSLRRRPRSPADRGPRPWPAAPWPGATRRRAPG